MQARLNFNVYQPADYKKNMRKKILWWTHKHLFHYYYPTAKVSENWLLISNSAVTLEHASKTFDINPLRIPLIHPPTCAKSINVLLNDGKMLKENIAVCLGRFEPDKNYAEVISAFTLLSLTLKLKLILIGFSHNLKYVDELKSIIRTNRLEDCVDLILNADRKTVLENLFKAKVLIHPALNEPFGLSVVESMAAGCIPIVNKGFNGPWLEVTQSGRFGLGFNTCEELALSIKLAIESYDTFNIDSIIRQSFNFDETLFKKKILNVIEDFACRFNN